jgi:hypothetical protein
MAKWSGGFPMLLWVAFGLCGAAGTLKLAQHFEVSDDYTEEAFDNPIIINAFKFINRTLPKALPELGGRYPIELLKAWSVEGLNGINLKCEIQRLRLRYLVQIDIPRPEKETEMFLQAIEALPRETMRGEIWSRPSEDIINVSMEAIKHKFGEEMQLRNVVVFKTLNIGDVQGDFIADVENDLERILVHVWMARPFKEDEWLAINVEHIV